MILHVEGLETEKPQILGISEANLGQGSPETTRAKNWPTNIRKRLTELVEKGKLTSELGPFSLQTLEARLSTVASGLAQFGTG